jgi:hypothetical protein
MPHAAAVETPGTAGIDRATRSKVRLVEPARGESTRAIAAPLGLSTDIVQDHQRLRKGGGAGSEGAFARTFFEAHTPALT